MVKLSKYILKYWYFVILLLVFVVIQTQANLTIPELLGKMMNEGIMKQDQDQVIKIGMEMLGYVFVTGVAAVFASYFASVLSTSYGRDVREDVFKRVETYSASEFDQISTASLITRSTNDIVQTQTVWYMLLRLATMAPIMGIGGFTRALKVNEQAGVVFGVAIGALALIFIVVSVVAIPLFTKAQRSLDKLNLVARERLTGVRVIRAYNRDQEESKRFDFANMDLKTVNTKVNRIMAVTMPLFQLIMSLTIVAIIWLGANQIQQLKMSGGDIMTLIQYASQVLFAFIMVAMIFIMVPRASASAKRINEVLDLQPSIVSAKHPIHEFPETGTIEFKDVSFTYPGAELPVLQNISFKSRPGEITAIIGGTGSGKSTFINLIPRFYEATKGTVLIDGVDINAMDLKTLRSKIGLVPQKAVLFSGTVATNLEFGKPGASEEEMWHALTVAQSRRFVEEKEDNLNSEVAQGGKNFSGGQKQRLSIARAIIKKPNVYIFDDSFSALDYKTDSELRSALKDETKDASVIIVGQRIASIMDADRILVLDQGEVIGMGTHEELMNSCEVYQEIARSQLSQEEIERGR